MVQTGQDVPQGFRGYGCVSYGRYGNICFGEWDYLLYLLVDYPSPVNGKVGRNSCCKLAYLDKTYHLYAYQKDSFSYAPTIIGPATNLSASTVSIVNLAQICS